jgi:nucleotide-binding universal stress UspA family protein
MGRSSRRCGLFRASRSREDVVVPVDFEPASYHALVYAQDLTRAVGARLHLLHVRDDAFALPAGTEGSLSAFPQLARRTENQAAERLNELLDDEDQKSGAVTVVVISPDPATAIVRYAEQVHASAIVMGTHGRIDKPEGAAIGSVAEQVIRTARCPVLVMRQLPQEALVAMEPARKSAASPPPLA